MKNHPIFAICVSTIRTYWLFFLFFSLSGLTSDKPLKKSITNLFLKWTVSNTCPPCFVIVWDVYKFKVLYTYISVLPKYGKIMIQKQLYMYLSLYINLCYLLDDIVPPMLHEKYFNMFIWMYISSVYSVSPKSTTGGCFPPSLRFFSDKFWISKLLLQKLRDFFPKFNAKLGQSKTISIFAMFMSHMTCPYLVSGHAWKKASQIWHKWP